MKFYEKDLENYIFKNDNLFLRKLGLQIDGKKYRQFKVGNYGIIDILTIVRYGDYFIINIYELKRKEINIYTFLQTIKYLKAIKNYIIKRFKNKIDIKENFSFKITLIGNKIDINNNFIYLNNLLNESNLQLDFYLYKLENEKILFNKVGKYKLINEGF